MTPQKTLAEAWLRRPAGSGPRAIVLGASVNGLSFVRSLGRRGIETLLLDSAPVIGTYSRYGKAIQLPPPEENVSAWLEFLQFVGTRLQAPGILFATSDAHCVLVARNAGLLAPLFRFLVPSAETVESILDKRTQYGIARAAGVLIPETHFPESADEIAALAAHLAYPCILKPLKSHSRKIVAKVVVVESAAALVSEYRRIAGAAAPFMVQEIVPGDDTALVGYLAFWDAHGREKAWLTKRKLRQSPPLFGDGSLQITVDAPDVADLSRHLLKAFDYRGFVGVEFKFDRREGAYRLMEINPRTVSGNQLAISAGVDFPWIGYQHLCGDSPSPRAVAAFRIGVKYVNEEWDFKAFLAMRKSGTLNLRSWLASLRGCEARAIGALDDPLPLVVVLWRLLRASLRRLRIGGLSAAKPGRVA